MAKTAQGFKKKVKQIEKEKRKKTAGELYSLSQKILENPALLRIVLNAPEKKDGHINLTSVYNAAFDYVYGKTGDLKKSKELAVATRWGAKFKDDHPTEFEIEIIEAKIKTTLALPAEKSVHSIEELKFEPKPEPKDMEIELLGDIITTNPGIGYTRLRIKKNNMPDDAIVMAGKFLQAITGIKSNFLQVIAGIEPNFLRKYPLDINTLRDYLIKILEEKFGLTIQICGNCNNYIDARLGMGTGRCRLSGENSQYICHFGDFNQCFGGNHWFPKEISEERQEKKEEEKTCLGPRTFSYNCGNCGYADCTGLRVPCGNWIPMGKKENK